MPWCPNCHAQYEEGVELCKNCDTKLVTEFPNENEQSLNDYAKYKMQKEFQQLCNAKSTVYVKKSEQYEDMGSSAIIFLGFGIVGTIAVLLNLLHILHLPFFDLVNEVSKGALLIIFIAFFIIGIFSLKKAKQLKAEISTEENITEKVTKWMEKEFTKEFLKQNTDPALSNEVNFLNQISEMKQLLILSFPNIESDYLDMLIEEYYNSHFED